MRLFALTLALVGSAFVANAENFEIPGSAFGYGNWEGNAWANGETGQFSHCAISAPYVSGDTLVFSVTNEATVVVGVMTETPVFRAGQSIPVAIYVDRRAPFYGRANAIDSQFATLEIPDFDRAMTAFKKGFYMAIEGGGVRGEYSLQGTFRALEMASSCAIANYNYSAPSSTQVASTSDVDRTILFQVATGMISDLGVRDFDYLKAAELQELGLPENSVFWESKGSGIFGGTLVLPFGGDESLKDTDPGDTGFLAGLCEGDFASSARDVGDEMNEIRELRVMCRSGDRDSETFLTKIRFGNEVLYTMLTFYEGQNEQTSSERQSMNEVATLKAARFVVE